MSEDIIRTYAINVLWITSLMLPYLLFTVHNKFHNKFYTFLRAMLAIILGWIYVIAYSIGANAIKQVVLVQNNKAIITSDASFAFAFSMGWILPTIIVVCVWVFFAIKGKRNRV